MMTAPLLRYILVRLGATTERKYLPLKRLQGGHRGRMNWNSGNRSNTQQVFIQQVIDVRCST